MKKVVVIDAQGGGIGRQIIVEIKKKELSCTITAIGANATATTAMLKAGADQGASGENPVVVACRTADVIMGPIGIVITDAMLGEITSTMATAIGQSAAAKILIPFNHCDNYVAGVKNTSMKSMIEDAVEHLQEIL